MGIKVLFIYPNTYGMNMLPPAIAMFSAILKKHGHESQIFDTTYYSLDYGIDSDGSKMERAEKNDTEGNRIYTNLKAEYLEKYMPKPDAVAVNGPNAWETLKATGQNMNQYVKVEALRYQYLSRVSKVKDSGNTLYDPYKSLRLMVLGDLRLETTQRMLLVIEKTFKDIKDSYEIQIKPHPGNPVDLYNYPLLRAEIVTEDLSDLLPQADLVLTSGFTSAALDAFCAGIRVVCYLDPYDLNYSILRGVDGVEFISSSRDLLQVLKQDRCISNNLFKPENFFWLNPELPLWKALLGLDQKYIAKKKQKVLIK